MIQFKCPRCDNPLRVPDEKAGVVAACPKCKEKLKVPTPKAPLAPGTARKTPAKEQIEEVVPEDFDDEEEETPRKKAPRSRDEEDEDRPRKGKGKPKSRSEDGDDEDDQDDEDDRPRRKRGKKKGSEGSGKNVVSGVVYILLGLVIAGVGVGAPMMMELQVSPMVPMIFGPAAGLLIAGLGIFYIVRK